MKNYFIGIAAVILAVAASAFTAKQQIKVTPKGTFTSYFFKLSNINNNPLAGSSYQSMTQAQYEAAQCSGSETVCTLVSDQPSLPASLTDSDSDGIPDISGHIQNVETRDK